MKLDESALKYARTHRPHFLQELREFVHFPTISAQPRHAADVKKCAAWLARHLRRIGLESVKVVPTARHPIVYASWQHAPGQPTVLIYGHYDVQPVDPVEEWQTPPFKPVVRDNNLYGRGASDDKGQLFTHVKAIESYLQTTDRLPVNIKCIFDGEEEIGSPNLPAFLRKHQSELQADLAVLSDTPLLAPDRPAITYALRGDLKLELEVRGAKRDLHAGQFGGAVHNPLQALCDIIASLHDANGHVAIAGFYDRVRRSNRAEREYLLRFGPHDKDMLHDAEEERGWGERGYTLYERTVLRPAITVNGLAGGYQGPGMKAVIPARAVAKLNLRLVPDQDPREIERLFRRHVARVTPPTVRAAVRTYARAKPVAVDPRLPIMRAAANAYRKGFGARPVFRRSGGTISAVNLFRENLGIPTVLMGFALPDDHMHAPNEKFYLPNFYNGIATCIQFLSEVGASQRHLIAPNQVGVQNQVGVHDH